MNELWRCPTCNRPFANVHQSHSCGIYTVDEFLKNRSPHSIALFKRFAELVAECGPVITAPVKTRVGFQVRMIFAAVYKLTDQFLEGHVVLARRFEHPRFRKIESFSPLNHAHHFRIHSLDELDDEVKSWLQEAYKVGKQEHLLKKERSTK